LCLVALHLPTVVLPLLAAEDSRRRVLTTVAVATLLLLLLLVAMEPLQTGNVVDDDLD